MWDLNVKNNLLAHTGTIEVLDNKSYIYLMPSASILLHSQRDLCSVMTAEPIVVKWDMEPFENLTPYLCMQILKIWIIFNPRNVLIPWLEQTRLFPLFESCFTLKSLFLRSKRCLSNDQSSWMNALAHVSRLEGPLCFRKTGIVSKWLTLALFSYSPLLFLRGPRYT